MPLGIRIGNFLYHYAFPVYRPVYSLFKRRQDRHELALLTKLVKPGHRVLDIGANIGFYARRLSLLVGSQGEVHCFEPDAVNFAHLKRATSGLVNVYANHKAVGPATEQIHIYTSKELNVDHRTYRPEEYDQELTVDCVSIDDYLGANLNIDLIKIDIQGFEFQAMQGMLRVLEHNPRLLIISEFWPYGLRVAGSSAMTYFRFLESKGFICHLMKNNGLQQLTEPLVAELEPLGKEHYFNIFAERAHV